MSEELAMHFGSEQEEILHQVIDDFAMAIFIVADDLRVTQLNNAARHLLEQAAGMRIEDGRLRTSSSQQEELAAVVAATIGTPPTASTCTYAMAIDRCDSPPLHVCVRPLTANGRPMAALYVIDPVQHARLDEQLLRRAYRLSRAEIRVVNELLQGQSVENVAEVLSVSVHTIRTHLKNIFAKTGTCRQAELVRLMSSCLGGLRLEPGEEGPTAPPPESSDIFRRHDQQSRRFRG